MINSQMGKPERVIRKCLARGGSADYNLSVWRTESVSATY